MKFIIDNTSNMLVDIPGAQRETILFKPFVASAIHGSGPVPRTVRTIEVDSLEQLIELSNTCGEIIIGHSSMSVPPMPTIEIYDTHRE
jgi:hypothetical protein